MNKSATVRVWDPFIRLFHWGLVTTFGICYFTQEEYYELHLDTGYILLGLVLARILWGLVGSRHARFSDFLYSPAIVLHYLKDLAQLKPKRYLGHTPAGGAMIIALLLCMLVITSSGIALDAAENRAGPLGDTLLFTLLDQVNTVHVVSTDIAAGLIAIHLLVIIVTSMMHKQNLVRSMITGRKHS